MYSSLVSNMIDIIFLLHYCVLTFTLFDRQVLITLSPVHSLRLLLLSCGIENILWFLGVSSCFDSAGMWLLKEKKYQEENFNLRKSYALREFPAVKR